MHRVEARTFVERRVEFGVEVGNHPVLDYGKGCVELGWKSGKTARAELTGKAGIAGCNTA